MIRKNLSNGPCSTNRAPFLVLFPDSSLSPTTSMTSVHELSNDATIGYANEGEIDYKSKQPSVGPLASTQLAGATEEEVIDEEPELHARTWIAIAALFLLNFVQCFALTGTPSIVGSILRQIGSVWNVLLTLASSTAWVYCRCNKRCFRCNMDTKRYSPDSGCFRAPLCKACNCRSPNMG